MLARSGIVVALVALALAQTAVAAQQSYAQDVSAAAHSLTTSLGDLGAVAGISIEYPVKPSAGRRASAKLAAAQSAIRAAATKLRTLHPPARAATANARLAAAADALAKQIAPVLAQIRNGYLVAAGKLPDLTAAAQLGKALTALHKLGYRVA